MADQESARSIFLDLARITASVVGIKQRAEELLEPLRRAIPFDSAWVALRDPHSGSYVPLASRDIDAAVDTYLAGPVVLRDMELTGANRHRPPRSLSDLPFPASELQTWAECLLPAGYREGLGVPMFTYEERHIGFLALLSADPAPPTDSSRSLLAALAPVIALALDSLRSVTAAALLVKDAVAAVVLTPSGPRPLPGLPGHRLLVADSAPLRIMTRLLAASSHVAFLAPARTKLYEEPRTYLKVTGMRIDSELPSAISAVVVLSPSGDLHRLTSRELEIVGLLIAGWSNRRIASTLAIAQRTVAAHIEHILAKLRAPTRALAAVRALQQGVYIPRGLGAPA